MDRTDLKHELERLHIRRDAYQIDGDGNVSEAMVIRPVTWEVFYAERGLKTGRKEFNSESEACEYLLLRLATDRSARDT